MPCVDRDGPPLDRSEFDSLWYEHDDLQMSIEAVSSNPNVFIVLDEFNRVPKEPADQIITQCSGLSDRMPIVITMNINREDLTDLRDSITDLPRFDMVVPEYSWILEVLLASQGFEQYSSLANQTMALLHWCTANLTRHDFYDFGLRAVKQLSRFGRHYMNKGTSEAESMFRSICITLLPQLTAADSHLTEKRLCELFPDLKLAPIDLLEDLPPTVRQCLQSASQHGESALERKLGEFLITTEMRHGLGVLSPCPHDTLHALSMCAHVIGR